MKIFTDGSLVGRTAAMSAPYDGDPGNSGYLQADAAELTATIGDRAIDVALDAFAMAADRYPRPAARHRIEHFAASRPDQVLTLSERKVLAVGQGRFATRRPFNQAVVATIVGGELRYAAGLARGPDPGSP